MISMNYHYDRHWFTHKVLRVLSVVYTILIIIVQCFCRGAPYMCTTFPFFPIILTYALRN